MWIDRRLVVGTVSHMSTSAITELVTNTNRAVTGDDVEGSPYDVCIHESRPPNRACLLLYEDARAVADVLDI